MLHAYCRQGQGKTRILHSIAAVREHAEKENAVLWVDLEAPTEQLLNAIGEFFRLDPDALDDCLHGEQRPRIDEFGDYFFLVIYGMIGADEPEVFSPRKLAAFCGSNYLITVHRQALVTVQDVRARCARNGSQILNKGPDGLLFLLIDGMVDRYVVVVDALEEQVDALEEQSLHPQVEEHLLEQLSEMRKQILELRRVASAQKELVLPLARGEFDYLSEELEQRFRHVRDHMTEVVERFSMLRDRLQIIRDNYHSFLAKRTNMIVQTLTVISAILLPLTFIAGVYGMNYDKSFWPPPEHPSSFVVILSFMALIALVFLIVFRWRRWL